MRLRTMSVCMAFHGTSCSYRRYDRNIGCVVLRPAPCFALPGPCLHASSCQTTPCHDHTVVVMMKMRPCHGQGRPRKAKVKVKAVRVVDKALKSIIWSPKVDEDCRKCTLYVCIHRTMVHGIHPHIRSLIRSMYLRPVQ